ncbi:virulence factor SrfC family protein [Cedecea sp.]|jgi:hypothetical protein|uniref:virulence factor SrfC family protein n=1 Tax=Cedecea sp. TaxID=1970739 RepID=UPI002F42912A
MKQLTTTLTPLVTWVQMTRTYAPLLDNEADSLLARLLQLSERQRRISALEDAPLTLGIYGHALDGKNHLLNTLQGSPNGRIDIQLGDKRLDYLTHINPGHTPVTMAVRFSSQLPPEVDNYPLLLTLFSEAELAQQFINQYHATATPRLATSSAVTLRLAELESRRQTVPTPGLTSEQIADLLNGYHRLQRRQNHLDERVCYQMAQLAPSLSIEDRAVLFALLWGEDSALTETWKRLALALQHLGNVERVLAPASLVVDNFLLPAEGFLIPAAPEEAPEQADVMVCPLSDNLPGSHLSLPQQDLAQLCAEVIFTLSQPSALPNVDLLDIPSQRLAWYTTRLQPDTLLVCNAVNERSQVQPTGKALAWWVDSTQSPGHSSLPGLVWAITPFDARFTLGASLDDGVQRLVGYPGKRWGTLQALDSRNMHRLLEWLTDALNSTRREQRITALRNDLDAQTVALFQRFSDAHQIPPQQARQQAEDLVRALQARATQHGNLLASLVPSRDALQQRWLQHQQQHQPKPEGFALEIDLFADGTEHEASQSEGISYARAVHQLWVNHLRLLGHRREAAHQFGLDSVQLQALCDVLIVASYRLDVPLMLERSMQNGDSGLELDISRASTVLGDFIAWLGYASVPVSGRPASRVNKGLAVFAPPAQADISRRLTQLGEQPTRGNASYVYDWLVALYTRATENIGYQNPLDINEKQRQTLLKLLG